MPKTEEEIRKAKEKLSAEGKDEQTKKDRVDESVAAQEEHDGDEDSQSAEDRVDESEGAERADEESEENAAEEGEEESEEKPAAEQKEDTSGFAELVRSIVAEEVRAAIADLVKSGHKDDGRHVKEAGEDKARELSLAEQIYNS